LLRVDQLGGNGAGMIDCRADRAWGDFGEYHPVQFLALEQAALLEDLGDMPGDRLAFAVRVGR
jgi:hypothetical protein